MGPHPQGDKFESATCRHLADCGRSLSEALKIEQSVRTHPVRDGELLALCHLIARDDAKRLLGGDAVFLAQSPHPALKAVAELLAQEAAYVFVEQYVIKIVSHEGDGARLRPHRPG